MESSPLILSRFLLGINLGGTAYSYMRIRIKVFEKTGKI
jgi:hypothetical protein